MVHWLVGLGNHQLDFQCRMHRNYYRRALTHRWQAATQLVTRHFDQVSLCHVSVLAYWCSSSAFVSIFSGFAKSVLLLPTAEALGQLKWSWFTGKRSMIDFEVMDTASRGLMGSVLLLMRSKGITLVSIGAGIILLSLPLDLFFQQIVAYPEPYLQDMFVKAPTIARSIWYYPEVDLQWRSSNDVVTNDFQIESILTLYWVYIYIELRCKYWLARSELLWICRTWHCVSSNNVNRNKLGQYPCANILLECPTSNYTFDPFYTLALDYEYRELPTNTLEFGCRTVSGEWRSSVSYDRPATALTI